MSIIFASCHSPQVNEESSVFVKTSQVKQLETTLTKNYPARIRAASDINLSFRVAGPILKVNVNEGEQVEKGDVVAEIDPRDYRIQLQATEAKYREVKAEVERITALYNKDKVSENDYEKAISGLKQVTAKYHAHQNALEDTRLKAPFAGQINKIFFDQGETVDAGMPIISLIDSQQYEIVTHIPAQDYLKKENFSGFICKSANLPGLEWPLELRNIVSQANLNGLYPVFFTLKTDSKDNILPGMSAEVLIKFMTDQRILFEIPLSAIFEKTGESKVWIINKDDGTIHSRNVEIERIKSSGIAIVNGDLKKSDILISAGVHSLKEGQKVRQLPAPTKSNVGNLM
nr:efflux RND transporter periplasmic adaptor subunit [Marinilabilia sp.]